jgi:adenine phosphoribosyltransferase
MSEQAMRDLVRDVPDFPQPGILFRDITPLLGDGPALQAAVDALARAYPEVDAVVGIESRGFILGAPVAYALGVGLILVR